MSVHLAKGARDFLPDAMAPRLAVVDRLREVFSRHGFEPLETPAFERIETLLGKYGDEGQKLIFKILKRGAGGERGKCDLALRYDLTVPLARVIAMNPGLRLPFKRWQVAPVWRADRPAKGRFREFVQCDADIVGSTEAIADAECIALASAAMTQLGLDDAVVRLNDRRVLAGLAQTLSARDREGPLLVTIDKLDKIGRDGVTRELEGRGFDAEQIARMWTVLDLQGDNASVLAGLAERLEPSADVDAGLERLAEVLTLCEALGVPAGRVRIDPTLARGLDYYTGPVFEVTIEGTGVGSLAGGGRYDGLIGVFGKTQVPAVGVALGLDRLLLVLEERGLLDAGDHRIDVLVTVYDPAHRVAAVRAAAALRAEGVRVDLYAGPPKLKAQMKYAHAKGVRWVVVIGPDEAADGRWSVKNMGSGKQDALTPAEAIACISSGNG